MSALLKPCIDCGDLTEQSRCTVHRPPAPPKAPAKERGYDHAWRRLSERARKLQPFCTWCLSTEDLQLDHTPEAWARKEAGKTIRLCDVQVLCGPCNRTAGKAKPGQGQRTTNDRTAPVTEYPTGKVFHQAEKVGEKGRSRRVPTPGVEAKFV